MRTHSSTGTRTLVALFALAISGGASLAAPPDDHGNGKGKSKKAKSHQPEQAQVVVGRHFGERQRSEAANYYGQQRKAGHCPPGLAKKNNGCMPPGQARKWSLGQPLPGGVVFYPVPQAVIVRIGPPPVGYRYVRVANDLLMIAIGSQMVVDAIEDLMRL